MRNLIFISMCVLIVASQAWAGSIIMGPTSVGSKEYSNYFDEDSAGAADSLQVIWWDGTGGATDTFDYSGASYDYSDCGQVDALANHGDAYFYDVISDQVPLLVSFHVNPYIHYTMQGPGSHANPPRVGVWATPQIINAGSPPDDVDALEVWGPGTMNDADRFSLTGDPFVTGIGRVSVWNYDYVNHIATPFISAAQIAAAIGRTDLADCIDLDAMMTYENTIMFSIAPISNFDGGEIWVWTVGAGPATYLVHGGEVWDTAHDVTAHFSGYGYTVNENINALEAVPEPTTMMLLGLSGMALLRRRKR